MRRDLFLASESGEVETFQNLYRQDSHVLRDVTFEGDTPLHIAARKGHLDLVRWILAKEDSLILDKEDPLAAARNKDHNTPLHEAAKSGKPDLVHILLQHKQSNAYRYNKFGETALMIASEYGHVAIVMLLLEAQPNANLVERNQHDRDLEAVYRLYIQKIEWELSVREAAYRGYRDIVVEMLNHPITPINLSLYDFVRVKRKSDEVIADCAERIRKYQHTLTVSQKWGMSETTPKIVADFAKRILSSTPTDSEIPADFAMPILRFTPNASEILGLGMFQIIPKTPILHTAVQGGHLPIVEAMLTHDSWQNGSMGKMDEYGRCAVHVAAMNGRWQVINEFMFRMPDCIAIRSVDHKSVLHFAVEYNQLHVVRNLLANKDAETVRELVSRDHDCFGNTALHLAVLNEVNPQIVEYLLSLTRVDVNALNDEGLTALDIAQHNPNCADIVQNLKNNGGILLSFIPKSNRISDPRNDSNQGMDKDTVNTHMVVASLIATVTFAAMFQIPGGIEDDKESIHYGAAKMAFHKLFRLFIFSDTAAFTASLTVVSAWLLKNTSFGSIVPRVLSDMSGVNLVISIIWTMIAFVSATILVIIPHNYENLKSKDKEAFSKYKLFWQYEISLVIITTYLLVGMLVVAFDQLGKMMKFNRTDTLPFLVFVFSTTIAILCFTFK